ncbi:exopolyphosphatase [Dermacoccus nishinomiyaensis]|uniref:Ppx/GppA phosphatase family protein n=1 Tax=Dermacoccus nishinomiyaensis TaxID=1274 RepID=UPI001EF6966A|nr:exopolyphosphatase [Dermacoccus nishinomiyaensis]MCG7430709.1 exopolyphosphatase [Dermacoccus nishinomiyaensis]
MSERRVAAIDCGTNSIRLLVAADGGSGLTYLARRSEIVRLGQGIDVSGRIADAAMQRTLLVTREYAQLCREYDVDTVRFVATSASRDAANADEFTDGVRRAFAAFGDDVVPEVVSGLEEAALSFAGATAGLGAEARAPYLVVDLGGGSTELVRGSQDVQQSISLDIGSVRLSERHLRSDPPTQAEIDAALVDIDAALDEAEAAVDLSQVATLVGLAGSITTVTAHALGLPAYDSSRIHGACLTSEQVIGSCDAVLGATRAERGAMGFMHPGRVDVIGAGALIWRTIVERVRERAGVTTCVTSESDILDGIAMSML